MSPAFIYLTEFTARHSPCVTRPLYSATQFGMQPQPLPAGIFGVVARNPAAHFGVQVPEGAIVGLGVGLIVGRGVGAIVGRGVGLIVGRGVGAIVGRGVGAIVGRGVGAIVGRGVGLIVGIGLGVGRLQLFRTG